MFRLLLFVLLFLFAPPSFAGPVSHSWVSSPQNPTGPIPAHVGTEPSTWVIPRNVLSCEITGYAGNRDTLVIRSQNAVGINLTSMFNVSTTTATFDGIAGSLADAPTWFATHRGVRYNTSIDGGTVNFLSGGSAVPAPAPFASAGRSPTPGTTVRSVGIPARPLTSSSDADPYPGLTYTVVPATGAFGSTSGGCANGQCGAPGAGFQPFGGFFRRR